ncbi:MAG: tRNA (5-methylaminomethyl-2-thiouridine)(34)-methyltransferase MnmD [Pseudomonadota bacterium]
MGGGKAPELDWRDGVPVARAFDDPYYSLRGGADEAAHVFLAGNGLPDRMTDGFHVAELGFGTGLNALVTARAWSRAGRPGRLVYTAFEAFPLTRADMARALAPFDLGPWADALLSAWPTAKIALPGLALEIVEGDARETLPIWAGRADAWYLDGFAPARNPELWGEALLADLAWHTAPGGTAATYSAAGHVRRGLAAAGFEVRRVQGFAGKRHMTVAQLP